MVEDIQKCGTEELGFHILQCEECGYEIIENNSWRNRHCPTCQSIHREKWIQQRKDQVLPTGHLHVAVTVPEELNSLFLKNQSNLYKALFSANSETLMELADSRQHLGGKIGLISILHTWGQNLSYHPHIHSIVTAGAISTCAQWLKIKKHGKFFVHVNVISQLFKGKFLSKLENLYYENKLQLPAELKELRIIPEFEAFIQRIRQKEFVSYCKEPFKSTDNAIEYIGRYSHRVAISNSRIKEFTEGQVTFEWRDYRDNQLKLLTLSAEEFIRRMLMHVLPSGLVKIRYYGLYSNRRNELLEFCRKILICEGIPDQKKEDKVQNLKPCPCCNTSKFKLVAVIYRRIRDPPLKAVMKNRDSHNLGC